MKEKVLYGIIESHLKKKGYSVFQDFPTGRWNSKRVDLIGVKTISKEIVSVEVKIRNFRRTVEQACYRLFFSDFVYLAFPYQYANHVVQAYRSVFKKYGFGLMSVDRDVEVLIPPIRSTLLNEDFKNYIIDLIQSKLGRI